MSELKVYHCNEWNNEYTEFYPKSEADKVIADLIEKNKRLASKDIIMASETIKDLFKEIHHQKFKRCLAMAWWCIAEAKVSDDEYRMYWWVKWHKRWLKIAEQFKEAK